MIEKQFFQPTVEMSDDQVQVFADRQRAIRRFVSGIIAAALINLAGCAGPGGTKSRQGTSEVTILGGEVIQMYFAQVEVPNDIAVATVGAKRQMPGGPAYDAVLPHRVTSDGQTKTGVNQAIGVFGIAAPAAASVYKTDRMADSANRASKRGLQAVQDSNRTGIEIAEIDARGIVDAAAARRPDQVNVSADSRSEADAYASQCQVINGQQICGNDHGGIRNVTMGESMD